MATHVEQSVLPLANVIGSNRRSVHALHASMLSFDVDSESALRLRMNSRKFSSFSPTLVALSSVSVIFCGIDGVRVLGSLDASTGRLLWTAHLRLHDVEPNHARVGS